MQDLAPFGAWLKQRRKTLDLTQGDLANLVGCSTDTIYRLEAGTRRPSKQIVRRLLAVLEIPADQASAFLNVARSTSAGDAVSPGPAANETTSRHRNSVARPPVRLPLPPAPLVGRRQEMADLCALLLRDEVRLVTLLGPAGVGKTRLSLAVAAELSADFEDGVVWVSLAAVADPEAVGGAIAQVLGVRETAGEPLQEQIATNLRGRLIFLVLDNFEQVIGAAPLVGELLATCPGLTMLVTSREPLRLLTEWLFDLEGLEYPQDGAVADLEAFDAVRLFIQRARQMQRRWTFTEDEALAVARICRLVEGLPLAIELAASAIRERSGREIARDLESSLRSLAFAAHDLPERHQSIWAALEHSWQLLSIEEQRVFPRLAVFRGGFQEEGAKSIAGVSTRMLGALAGKSLLRQTTEPDGTRRYRLHELVQHYAGEKLRDVGEEAHIQAAHLQYYLALAERAEPLLIGREQPVWLLRLESEHDNLRVALGRALTDGKIEAGLRLAAALERFWYLRGYWSEGRAWLARMLRAAETTRPSLTRGRALLAAGELAHFQSDYAAAAAAFAASKVIFQELGDDLQLAMAWQGMAFVARNQGDFEREQQLWEQILPVFRADGDPWNIGNALHGLGSAIHAQGDLKQASRLFDEGLSYYRSVGSIGAITSSLIFAARIAREGGELARARTLCEEGLQLAREIGNKHGMAWALRELGSIHLTAGDFSDAEAVIAESLQIRWELRDAHGAAWSLEGLAEVAYMRRLPVRAAWLWGQAEALRETVGAPMSPDERVLYEQQVASMRAALDEEQFAAAWAIGRRLKLAEAVANAIDGE